MDKVGDVNSFEWNLWFVVFIFIEVYGYYDYMSNLKEDDVEISNKDV